MRATRVFGISARARRDLSTLLTVLVAQAAIGYVQYFSDVPPLLVAIHVAGATTLWITDWAAQR